MRRLTANILGLLLACSCAALIAAPLPPKPLDVRNIITVTQFHQTGLDTLSPDQLNMLNAWLAQYLSAHPNAPVDVRNDITVTQFNQTGLDKLSPQQLGAFNAWLNQYVCTNSAAPPAPPPAAQQPGSPAIADFGAETIPHQENPAAPERIETRINGVFTGWDGNTVFKLENGQIWQQAGTGYFTSVKLDHPQVVIKKLAFGYLLTLPGQGETVFVKRIR